MIRSKQLLKQSLIYFLHTKSIHEITIKEICEQANVNRTTFYNHYSSQYELYDDIMDDVFETVNNMQQKAFGNDKKFSDSEATVKFFTEIFEYAEENKDICLVILGRNGCINIGEAFAKYIDIFIKKEDYSVSERYTVHFLSAGISHFLWMWLNDNDKVPAETIAEIFSVLYSKGVDGNLLR